MPVATLDTVLQQLRKMVSAQGRRDLSNSQLLLAFAAGHDQSAFTVLVQRHGPMVLRVCRHVLHHLQDAEDAFQATFLVLARQAASIRKPEAVASWLHGVALRIARNAKKAADRRRKHEEQAQTMSQQSRSSDLAWGEVQAVLDEEIQRLPSKYRTVFVLCCLESKSRAETAQQLGLKEGTVSSRLALARKWLHQRLAKRGITLTAVLGAAALTDQVTLATVPALLLKTTVPICCQYAWSPATAAGLISAEVMALVKSATGAWLALQSKTTIWFLLVVGVLMAGSGTLFYRVLVQPPAEDGAPRSALVISSPPAAVVPPARLARGPDLAQIDRTIAREPTYQSTPQYGLLVFGPQAATRVWLVVDGDTLYIDRKGNGDLTDPENRVVSSAFVRGVWNPAARALEKLLDEPLQLRLQQRRNGDLQERRDGQQPLPPEGPAGAPQTVKIRRFRVGDLVEGTARHTNLAVRVCEFEDGDTQITLMIRLNDRRSQYSSTGLLRLGRRSAEAPIIHLNGPLMMRLYQPTAVQCGQKVLTLKAVVGTPGLGQNVFAPLGLDQMPAGTFPTAVVAFPSPTPGGAPVEVKVALDQVNRNRTPHGFAASVRVPETVGEGPVQVTLSFPSWDEEPVVPVRVELPVVKAAPEPLPRPTSPEIPDHR
jgi:RNA polymerase sigma factor (sigma-70 family)